MLPLLGGLALRALGGAAIRGAAGAAVRGGGGALVRGAVVRGGGGALARGAVARGAGGGLVRGLGGAAARGIGGSIVRGVGTSLVKSALGGKKSDNKQVSTKRLIPKSSGGGRGGALVRTKTTNIVRSQGTGGAISTPEKKSGDGDLITELTAIKETLIKIKGVLGSNLANTLRNQKNQRILRSKEKASSREAELEKKGPEKKEKLLQVPKKKLSFFDMIWRFISNVLMGSLLNFLFNYAPQITKMFEEIGKGLENPLQQLRIGIITLTTLFPKQIKFLAKLTRMIIGPPAKLIGKLLGKAAGVAGFLFKKAGGFIFNLIKGPLNTLVKKIGGEALEKGVKGAAQAAGSVVKRGAARAVTRAGLAVAGRGGVKTAANIIKRFKAFSKVFKRVPIVGALIGIGIDLALGEPLDRAVVGAIGASLGGAIGGAIGQGLIPIPVVGAVVGGAVGASIGDWAAKKIYQNLTGRVGPVDKANPMPVEQRASGGGVGGVFRSIGSFFTGTTSTPTKAASKTTKISPQVAKKAQESVVKDEKSLQRFQTLSSIFAGTPFVGQILKMGIDIGLGASVEKPQTDAAAQDLGFTIGRALEDEEFSVPGLNKRIIGPLTKNLTEWAKKKIFYEVKAREGIFPTLEKIGEDETARKNAPGGVNGGGDNLDSGPGGGPTSISGTNEQKWKAFYAMAKRAGAKYPELVAAQFALESGWGTALSGTYNYFGIKAAPGESATTHSTKEEYSGKTVTIKAAFKNFGSPQEAVNHLVNQWYKDYKGYRGVNNASDAYAAAQMLKSEGYATSSQYVSSLHRLLKQYGNIRGNDADIKIISTGGGGGGKQEPDPNIANLPKQSKQIVFHWTAGSYSDTPDRYHTVFTGDGKKHSMHPYTEKVGGTLYRPDAINLSISANPDKGMWPKEVQLNAMAKEAAMLAKSWGWNKSAINVRNVTGHGEAGAGKDGKLKQNISIGREPSKGPRGSIDNYGPVVWKGDGSRWDLSRLKPGDQYGQGENAFREKVKANMGGGYGFNHHHLPLLAMGGGHVVTSSMGMRNFALSPGMHMGVDIAGNTGEPLQAFTDGKVEATSPPSPSAGYGNWVSWIDNKGIGHFYGHMNKAPFVKAGQQVKKGTVLGELGSTGNSSGPHLHWEAATTPTDTGRPKSAVLSRFNPLSKYNKESPFGGSIMPSALSPDNSQIAQTSDNPQVRSPGPGSSDQSGKNEITEADYSYVVRGAPAVGGMGGGSGISITSNGGGNKQLKSGKTYGFRDLNPHHSDEGVTRSYGQYSVGVPKDYGMGVLPQYMPSGPNGAVPLPVSGKVLMKEWYKSSGYGRTVLVDTSLGKMQFSHLSAFGSFKQGDQLSAGTVIGKQGGSGDSGENSYPEHLHINAPKAGHEAFVNFITSGKPTTGAVDSSGADAAPGAGAAGAGAAPEQTGTSGNEITEADYSYVVRGAPAVEGYEESFDKLYQDSSTKQDPLSKIQPQPKSNVETLQQKPSYDQGGKQNILMMPIPPQQPMTNGSNVTSGRQLPMDSMGLNNINSRAESARQVLSVVLFKL